MSSHLLTEVEHLADDVVVIHQGRLVTQGPLPELQQRASLLRTLEPQSVAVVLEAAGASTETVGTDGLLVREMPIDEVGERCFAAGVALHELSPQAGSLEELFLSWTTDRSGDPDIAPQNDHDINPAINPATKQEVSQP